MPKIPHLTVTVFDLSVILHIAADVTEWWLSLPTPEDRLELMIALQPEDD